MSYAAIIIAMTVVAFWFSTEVNFADIKALSEPLYDPFRLDKWKDGHMR